MQISDHIHLIKIPFQIPMAPGITVDRFVYAYLIDGAKPVLVDAGVAGSQTAVVDALARIGRRPEEIAHILLTHAHPDHIGAAKTIHAQSGADIWAHPAEKDWIEDTEQQFRERPIPGFHTLVEGPVKVDHEIADNDTIDLGDGMAVRVLHTPGHSRGSVSYYIPKDHALITGDAVLLAGQMPVFDDWQASVDSLNKLKGVQDVKLLLSSWDDPRENESPADILNASLACFHDLRNRAEKALSRQGSQDAMALCRQVMLDLGLPESMINPLTAKAIQAAARGRE